MAELKTKPNDGDVLALLNGVEDSQKKSDCFELLDLMKEITGVDPIMWGGSIVGFGSYHYKYASGREGDWFLAGFSPRKQNISIYIMAGFSQQTDLLEKLGKHKTGKGCLYIKRLSDIDRAVLKTMIQRSVDTLSNK